MADICTDHGYPMGTPGYLECWRIVSQQQMQQQLLRQRRLEMLFGATTPQPPQTYQHDDPPPPAPWPQINNNTVQPTFIQPQNSWCPNGARWCR